MEVVADTVEGRRGFRVTHGGEPGIFYAPVEPVDEWRLRQGVRELSPASRYLRFFSPVGELSEEQVYRFTHVDQVDHVAWGALDLSRPANPGVGLGRMVRDSERRDVAEVAIAVVDRVQRRGIGSVLMATLFVTGRARGIHELRALVLPENRVAMGWFERLGAEVRDDVDGRWVRMTVKGLRGAGTASAARTVELMERVGPLIEG